MATHDIPTENILTARGVNKYFYTPKEFHVIKNIDLDIKRGEFAAIMGKSGSGKSTLMYILSTLDTEYTGTMYLRDRQLTGLSEPELAKVRNADFGFVFQFHFLLEDFTTLQNVMLPGLKLKKKPAEQVEARALELLDMLGIKDQAVKKTRNLSGGQQQRVAIARALINDPAVIMGDEPTGNLDSKNSDVVLGIFRDLAHTHNQTILAVTHDDDFAARCDRTIWLKDGEVVSAEAV